MEHVGLSHEKCQITIKHKGKIIYVYFVFLASVFSY